MKRPEAHDSFKEYEKQDFETKEYFADRLKRERRAEGLSQKALASECGLSRQTINYLENAGRDPSLSHAIKIANCVGFLLFDLKPLG